MRAEEYCMHYHRYHVRHFMDCGLFTRTHSRLKSDDKDFLTNGWKGYNKLIRSPPFQTTSHEVISIKGIVPLLVCSGDLNVRTWSRIVEHLAVDLLLVASSIDSCVRRISSTDGTAVSYIIMEPPMMNCLTNIICVSWSSKLKLPAQIQTTLLVCGQEAVSGQLQ